MDIDSADVGRRYQGGQSVREIADHYRCSDYVIYQRLAAAGIERRPLGTHQRRREIDTAEVVRRYEAGESVQAIARTYGCAHTTIYNRLVAEGIETGLRQGRKRRPIDIPDMIRRREAGESYQQIATAHRCSIQTVVNRLAAERASGIVTP